eukprot:441948_1
MAATDDQTNTSNEMDTSPHSTNQEPDSLHKIHQAAKNLLDQGKVSSAEHEMVYDMISSEDSAIVEVIERNLSQEHIEQAILDILVAKRPTEMDIEVPESPLNEAAALICAEATTNTKIAITKSAIKSIQNTGNCTRSSGQNSKSNITKKEFLCKEICLRHSECCRISAIGRF